jgi:hypothetical protein
MSRSFKGKVALDIRDSQADWPAFLDATAPQDAPNVLVILYDDTGQAAWSPYGGRINMPTLDRLAKNGLIYTQWHTTAVCSPTRSCFLTGRNHHANGFGSITEAATGFPGYHGHIPLENGTIAQVLRDAGWSTFWIGKNHNVPVDAFSIGASKKRWPLGLGYDRFYGFIGGETNQWYPELIEDNHFVEQPYRPEQGYHFSKDIAEKAISVIRDSRQSEPAKPWYLWYCPGANHAPQEFIDKYRGKFDDGYEAYREWVLERMIERDILPAGTALTPINPLPEDVLPKDDRVRPWNTLSADEKKRRHVRPAGDPLAEGHQGERRSPASISSLHGHHADNPGVLRRADARRRRWRETESACGRIDALLVRRPEGAHTQRDAVLRDVRHARHLAQGLEGFDDARANAVGPGTFRPGPLAALQHRQRSCRSTRSGGPACRQARGAQGAVAHRSQTQQRAAAQ